MQASRFKCNVQLEGDGAEHFVDADYWALLSNGKVVQSERGQSIPLKLALRCICSQSVQIPCKTPPESTLTLTGRLII